MSLNTFLAICCAVFFAICNFAMWYFGKNVRLKYKDQRVGVRTKWWRR